MADTAVDVVTDAKDAKDAVADTSGDRDAAAPADVVAMADRNGDSGEDAADSSLDAGAIDSSAMDATTDGATVDSDFTDTGAQDGAVRMCPADPSVATPIQATAYRYDNGPNNKKDGKDGCSFLNAQLKTGDGLYYGAVDPKLLASAARCGACMRLVGPSNVPVTVRIVDVVSPLSSAMGETITVDSMAKALLVADPNINPDVKLSFVPCEVTGTIQISFAGRNDPAVLVMNHNNQLASVQFVIATGNVNLTRQNYNVWTPPSNYSFNGGDITLLLTDVFGNTVQTGALTVSTTPVDTQKQFPMCPP